MKTIKNLFIVLIVFLIFCLVILFCLKSTGNNNIKFVDNEYLMQQENKEDIIYIDYPLLEFYFMGNNNWDFIIEDDINGIYNLINSNEILESFKTNIVLNTFPVGKGTSADGYIYLYKDSELVKKVPFTQINCIGTSDLSFDSLKKYSKQDIENICGYLIND